MPDTLAPLIADLLDWVGEGRPYAEVMEAWRTSCPRLPVWEEANARGLLGRRREAGVEYVVPVRHPRAGGDPAATPGLPPARE